MVSVFSTMPLERMPIAKVHLTFLLETKAIRCRLRVSASCMRVMKCLNNIYPSIWIVCIVIKASILCVAYLKLVIHGTVLRSMYGELVLAICDLSLFLRLAVYGQLYTYSHWSSFQINRMWKLIIRWPLDTTCKWPGSGSRQVIASSDHTAP